MLGFLNKLKSRSVLAVLAIVMVAAGVTAVSPETASAQELIGNPGVTLYENPYYNNDPDQPGGLSLQVTESISCLTSQSFDNLTESIQVRPGTTVVLFTECGFLGKAESFSENDSDLNDNSALVVGARGGVQLSISSVLIIEDTESDGAEHQQLLNQLLQTFADLNARADTLNADLNARLSTVDTDAAANQATLLSDAAANTADLLADSAANTSTLLADAATNTADLLADSAANTSALLADAAAKTSALLADAAANFSALQATALANFNTLNDDAIENHANHPFEVTIQPCIVLGGEAVLSGTLGVEGQGKIEGSLGVDAYGNGASVEVKIPIKGTLSGSLAGNLGISTTACFEGVRVLDLGSHVVGGDALIEDFIEVGQALQDSIIGTLDAIGGGVEGLVSGLDALVALTSSGTGFDLTNPGTILDPNGEFTILLASLPLASQLEFDIDTALDAILNPCLPGGVIRSLGQDAANICDTVDTAAADTLALIQSIPTLVNDLFTATTALATDNTNSMIGLINISSEITNGAMGVVCNSFNTLVDTPIGFGSLTLLNGFQLLPRITVIPGTPAIPNPIPGLPGIPAIGSTKIGPINVPTVTLPAVNLGKPFSSLSISPCPGTVGSEFTVPAIPLIP